MVSFEIFVESMLPSLSELKVLPSFCFAFKIPDDRAVTIIYHNFECLTELQVTFERKDFLNQTTTTATHKYI